MNPWALLEERLDNIKGPLRKHSPNILNPCISSLHENMLKFKSALLLFAAIVPSAFSFPSHQEWILAARDQVAVGHNDLYIPDPKNPTPYKEPFTWDEKINYYEKHTNGSGDGYYRRASCPALNTLANRGFINRSGRNISYDEIAQAMRVVWNFGDDNVSHLLPAETTIHSQPADRTCAQPDQPITSRPSYRP